MDVIFNEWASLDFEVEQAEIVVDNKTTMIVKSKNVRTFENILSLRVRMAQW